MTMIQAFLEDTYRIVEATALEVYTANYKSKSISPDAYFTILSHDPTAVVGQGHTPEEKLESSKKGKYTDWMLRQYLKAQDKKLFLEEDISLIKDDLKVFISPIARKPRNL